MLAEREEADDGRDRRIDAVDDRHDARLESAEALEFESERNDQASDRDHETDFPLWLEENRRINEAGGIPKEPSQTGRLQVT